MASFPEVTPTVDQAAFREVVGHFMSGVTVITTEHDGERFGVTASAVSSLSLDPPMLLVCLNRRLATADAVAASGVFAVNILGEEQAPLAMQFATRHQNKFRRVRTVLGELGVPVLEESLAHIECVVEETVPAATHTVFLGRVRSAHARTGRPLAYFRGAFGRFAETVDAAVHRELRERVLSRAVPLGTRMTVECLASELGVTATPVYHALQQLRTEGLVSHDNGAYAVTPVTVGLAWQAYDARAAIECGVIDCLAGPPDAGRMSLLRAAADATLPWIRDNRFVDVERYIASNTAFHEMLVGLADNDVLLRSYREIAVAAVMARSLHGMAETNDRFTHDHVAIAELLGTGDMAGARRLVLEHTEAGKERVRLAIEAAGGQY